jgi:hypothetical protein
MHNKINKKKGGGKVEIKSINLVSKYYLASSLIATKHGCEGKTGIDYNIVLTDSDVFDVLAETKNITMEMITISYKDEILFNGRIEIIYIDMFINDILYKNIRLVQNKNKSGKEIINKNSHKFIMSENILSSDLNQDVNYLIEEDETEYLIKEFGNGKNEETYIKPNKEWKIKSYFNKDKSAGYIIDALWIATGFATAYYVLKK